MRIAASISPRKFVKIEFAGESSTNLLVLIGPHHSPTNFLWSSRFSTIDLKKIVQKVLFLMTATLFNHISFPNV